MRIPTQANGSEGVRASVAVLGMSFAIALSLSAVSPAGASASEVTGTLGSPGEYSGSQASGVLAANVTPGSTSSTGSSGSGSSSMTGTVVGGSSGSSGSLHSGSSRMESDGSLARSGDYVGAGGQSYASAGAYSGTGGGYDPILDAYLASLQGSGETGVSSSRITPGEAVAYNTKLDNSGVANAAAAGASGANPIEAVAFAAIGTAAIGLGAYAARAYLAYRNGR